MARTHAAVPTNPPALVALPRRPEAPIKNVLFLCTGNSARSVLAESYLNAMGDGRFCARSAGSHPTGRVNPFALELLRERGLPTQGLQSKSWDQFAKSGAPAFDFIFTVCDNAAGETCPLWPGKPVTAHWGVEDPAAVTGTDDEKRKAFVHAFNELSARIDLLLALPVDQPDRDALKHTLEEIGSRR